MPNVILPKGTIGYLCLACHRLEVTFQTNLPRVRLLFFGVTTYTWIWIWAWRAKQKNVIQLYPASAGFISALLCFLDSLPGCFGKHESQLFSFETRAPYFLLAPINGFNAWRRTADRGNGSHINVYDTPVVGGVLNTFVHLKDIPVILARASSVRACLASSEHADAASPATVL